METKYKLIAALVAALVLFVLGFYPQYSRRVQVEQELAIAGRQIEALQFDARLSQLRDLTAMMYVEVTRQNYGLAASHSSDFFNRLREVSDMTTDAQLKMALEDMMEFRDSITALLAQGDERSVGELQKLLFQIHEATRRL